MSATCLANVAKVSQVHVEISVTQSFSLQMKLSLPTQNNDSC